MGDEYIQINILKLDTKLLSFTKPRLNKSGIGKTVNILYDGKIPIVKLPKMTLPFGAGVGVFDKEGTEKKTNYSLDPSLDNLNENSPLIPVFKKFEEIDDVIMKEGIKNKKDWLSKPKASDELIKDLYKPLIKTAKDKEGNPKPYPSRIKLNLYEDKGRFRNFKLFDEKAKEINLTTDNWTSVVEKRDSIMTAVTMNRVWCSVTTGFGVTLEVNQARLFKSKNSLSNCILDNSDDEDSEKEQSSAKTAALAALDLEDEDISDESDVSDEE